MKTWEYKAKYMRNEDYIKGVLNKSLKEEKLEQELNALGNQGWEMVGVAYGDGVHNKVIVFKR